MPTDKYFRVELLSQTPNPQQVVYAALHQDYSEGFVWDERETFPSEERSGEIAVKQLLAGNRGHYGCYSADTEVLTEKGWMFWDELHALWNQGTKTKVLAVDIESGRCHFEQPKQMQQFALNPGDKLYQVESQYLNFAVTHDHRMVVSHRRKHGTFSPWYFKLASEVYGSPVRYLLNSLLDSGERLPPPELPENVSPEVAFKLAGFFFGDGVRSSAKDPRVIRFRIRRPRKIAYLLSLGLPSEEKSGDRYTIYHPELAAWVHKYFSSATSKTVPIWALRLPMNLIAAFWDGLKNSDGTRVTENSWSYDSTQKEALDIIQAVAHINGFSANMILNNPHEGVGHENHKPCWRLTFSEHSTRRVETCQNRSPGISERWIDYSHGFVYCATVSTGALMVRRKNKVMVSGNCLEHPQIILNCGWFPHSTMQQIRTHRVGISFDVQSGRYTSKRYLEVAAVIQAACDRSHRPTSEQVSKAVADNPHVQDAIDSVVYFRPVGHYSDRQGHKYYYDDAERLSDLTVVAGQIIRFANKIEALGFSEEHARGGMPFDVRQHWVVSMNLRSLMHLLTIRGKKDAQLECQQLCELILPHFEAWTPQIYQWFMENLWLKGRLAP